MPRAVFAARSVTLHRKKLSSVFSRLRRHRLIAWFACLLLVLASVAPALSQALADGGQWEEICTFQGARWVRVGDAALPDAGDSAPLHSLAGASCPMCLALQDRLLPPAPPLAVPAPVLPLLAVGAPTQPVAPTHSWRFARAPVRAPPGGTFVLPV